MELYGDRIREARKAKHMTQEELGELVGVTGVTIMRYEKYQREPRIDQLRKIAEVLGVSWTYLIGQSFGGETLEESAAIFQEYKESSSVQEGLRLIMDSIYGESRTVTVSGKWFDDSLTVYGEGDDSFVLGDEASLSIEDAVRALVKSLVSTLKTPAAEAEDAMRAFLNSKEAKQFYEKAVSADKARTEAMKEQRKAEAAAED